MKSTSAAPERILTFGGWGSGKSRGWTNIAEHYRTTNTPGKFYVINTEPGAIERMSDNVPGFTDNIEWTDVRGWYPMAEATTEYLKVAVTGDWIIFEGIDMPWQWIRAEYDKKKAIEAGKVPGVDDLFGVIEVVDDKGKWDPINAAYQRWIMPLIDLADNPAHVYATAPSKAVNVGTGKPNEWKTDQDNITSFGWRGVYPEGQKFLGRHFFSKIHMVQESAPTKMKAGKWTLTNIDDHNRELVVDQPVDEFVISYLLLLARWEM